MRIRELAPGEEGAAAELVRRSFDEEVAGDLSQEGIAEFYRWAEAAAMAARLRAGGRMLVAEDAGGDLAGVVEVKDGSHIALLFSAVRGHGVGRALMERALELCAGQVPAPPRITVNSSLGAVGFYQCLGFRAEGPERTVHGIRFVPMARGGPAR